MPSAARRLPCGMPERTRRSRGGGNLPPPRMSELARMHLHLPAPCSRLCTPPVPVEVPVDVPHAAFPDRFRVGDMAANRANACPPTRENCSEAERGNRRVFVRGHRPTAEPAGSARRPPPGGLRASTHPCVDGDKRAHALCTPSTPHTRVCGGISAGQMRAPLRPQQVSPRHELATAGDLPLYQVGLLGLIEQRPRQRSPGAGQKHDLVDRARPMRPVSPVRAAATSSLHPGGGG
jgi:hypothetical protein